MEAKCKYSYYKSSGDCAYLYPKRSISVCLWSLLFCIRKPPRSKHFVTTWNMQFFVVHLSLMVQSSVSYCMGTIIFTSTTKSSVWEITFKSSHALLTVSVLSPDVTTTPSHILPAAQNVDIGYTELLKSSGDGEDQSSLPIELPTVPLLLVCWTRADGGSDSLGRNQHNAHEHRRDRQTYR